jgi:hypothetical protein
MNIFCIDKDPLQSAKWLCDQHCNKMVLESAQMVANCFPLDVLEDAPKTQKGTPRKYSYWKHPCSIWARETMANLSWLLLHSLEMEEERKDRGFNPHFSADFLKWALLNMHRSSNDPSSEQTEFAIAISDHMTCRQHPNFDKSDVVGKYRLYYKLDKPFARWTSNKPNWIK